MLSIIFTILKIAGCILLALVLLILLAMCMVLFVPIRYRASGARYEDITANADVTWLFKLLHVLCSFDSKRKEDMLLLQVKVLGFTVYSNVKKQAQETGEEKKPQDEPAISEAITEQETPPDTAHTADTSEKTEETAGLPEGSQTSDFSARKEESQTETAGPSGKKRKKRVRKKPRRKEFRPSMAEKIQKKLEQLQKKAEEIRIKKDRVMKIIENEKNQAWLKKVLIRLKRLIIYLIPQIDRLYLHFGFKDPSSTGKTLGLLSMLYPVCEDRMELEPEFDMQVLEGEASIKGRIRIIRLAAFAVPSFINPSFIKLIKQVKRI